MTTRGLPATLPPLVFTTAAATTAVSTTGAAFTTSAAAATTESIGVSTTEPVVATTLSNAEPATTQAVVSPTVAQPTRYYCFHHVQLISTDLCCSNEAFATTNVSVDGTVDGTTAFDGATTSDESAPTGTTDVDAGITSPSTDSGGLPFWIFIIIGVVVLVLVLVVVAVVCRAKREASSDDAYGGGTMGTVEMGNTLPVDAGGGAQEQIYGSAPVLLGDAAHEYGALFDHESENKVLILLVDRLSTAAWRGHKRIWIGAAAWRLWFVLCCLARSAANFNLKMLFRHRAASGATTTVCLWRRCKSITCFLY